MTENVELQRTVLQDYDILQIMISYSLRTRMCNYVMLHYYYNPQPVPVLDYGAHHLYIFFNTIVVFCTCCQFLLVLNCV